jgi:hypothetical protein
MKAYEHAPNPAPAPALHPGLDLLIERGILSRAVSDGRPEVATAFAARVDDAVTRGEVTPTQAAALRQMLGLRSTRHARRSLQ